MDNNKKSCNNYSFAIYREYTQTCNPKLKKTYQPKAPLVRDQLNLSQVSQPVAQDNTNPLQYNNNISYNRHLPIINSNYNRNTNTATNSMPKSTIKGPISNMFNGTMKMHSLNSTTDTSILCHKSNSINSNNMRPPQQLLSHLKSNGNLSLINMFNVNNSVNASPRASLNDSLNALSDSNDNNNTNIQNITIINALNKANMNGTSNHNSRSNVKCTLDRYHTNKHINNNRNNNYTNNPHL